MLLNQFMPKLNFCMLLKIVDFQKWAIYSKHPQGGVQRSGMIFGRKNTHGGKCGCPVCDD